MKLLIVCGCAAAIVASALSGCSSKPEVPALEGQDLKAATANLQACGLALGRVDKQFTGTNDSGIVVRQAPAPKSKVDKGTTVQLVVEDSLVMPDLVGLEFESAKRTLEAQGLHLQRREAKFVGGSITNGVVEQSPVAGARVPANAAVNVVVDQFIVVPDFVDLKIEEVRRLLPSQGLAMGTKSSVSSKKPSGTIVSQQPEVGEKVALGTPIQFEIAGAVDKNGATKSTSSGEKNTADALKRTGKGLLKGLVDDLLKQDDSAAKPDGTTSNSSGDSDVAGSLKHTGADIVKGLIDDLGGRDGDNSASSAGLPAPSPIAPPQGQVISSPNGKITLQWAKVPGAASYAVEIQYSLGQEWLLFQSKTRLAGTSYTFNFAGQTGRWRVSAADVKGRTGSPSEWSMFVCTRESRTVSGPLPKVPSLQGLAGR